MAGGSAGEGRGRQTGNGRFVAVCCCSCCCIVFVVECGLLIRECFSFRLLLLRRRFRGRGGRTTHARIGVTGWGLGGSGNLHIWEERRLGWVGSGMEWA